MTGGSRVFGAGERDLRSVACCGRGLVWAGRFRDVVVVFADEVRENGGARGRPEVEDSFLGNGESFREDSADGTRGPGTWSALLTAMTDHLPPPPEPVLLIPSPPVDSELFHGTGDGAADPLETPTFLICARTWRSCLS